MQTFVAWKVANYSSIALEFDGHGAPAAANARDRTCNGHTSVLFNYSFSGSFHIGLAGAGTAGSFVPPLLYSLSKHVVSSFVVYLCLSLLFWACVMLSLSLSLSFFACWYAYVYKY